MSILKELWNGNISPLEQCSYRSNEYKKLSKELQKSEAELFCGLSKEKREQYEKCASVIFNRFAAIEEELFVYAFSLGARITAEVYDSDR